jgi:hypothetical protein
MAKFNEKLQELGLTENEVSKSIKGKIKNYNEYLQSYTDGGSSDEKLKANFEKLDGNIVASIEKWFANKDAQAERMRAMREKREAKKNSGEAPAKKPVKKEEIIEEEEQEEEENDDYEEQIELARREALRRQEFLRRQAAYQAQQQQQQLAQPKKKSKAIWVLAGLVAVVTLGAVILKDK